MLVAGYFCPEGSANAAGEETTTRWERRRTAGGELTRYQHACDIYFVHPGHYCKAGSSSSAGSECPAGQWCAGGDAPPVPCDVEPGDSGGARFLLGLTSPRSLLPVGNSFPAGGQDLPRGLLLPWQAYVPSPSLLLTGPQAARATSSHALMCLLADTALRDRALRTG
eukprot:73477-Hanusia_phi.AAC.2